MQPDSTRRTFLVTAAAGGLAAVGIAPTIAANLESDDAKGVAPWPGFPQQDRDHVQATVGASHGRFERVRELVDAYPELAKCAWDWGFGDWETPLGAASHTGQREIARYLIEHGARPNIFTFAMLGHAEVVRAMLDAEPALRSSAGPHGLTLDHHARVGGDEAEPVRKLLAAIPVDTPPTSVSGRPDAFYHGDYRTTNAPALPIKVASNQRGLTLQIGETATRNLFPTGADSFYPAGAPSVRVVFEADAQRVTALRVRAAGTEIVARP